jgi:phospholipid/cholesterol/gamma-HCH transport system permease protein
MVQSAILALGEFTEFGWDSFRSAGHLWKRRGLFLSQCEFIGVNSGGVLFVAALFLGSVMGYQLYITLTLFGAEGLLGGSVGVSMLRELGPVMTAIMVTGRAGAAMAAEIASMKVNEQVDALEVMAVDPIEYLAMPRVLAGILVVPILSGMFSAVASIAAAAIACGLMGLDPTTYWNQFAIMVDRIDMVHCLVKGAVFGLVLTWVGCFYGFRAYGGARAVGFATRSSVVTSVLVILFADYVLTSFLPFGFLILTVD